MLAKARNLAGLSLEEAAELAYRDRKALRRRENGEVPVHPDEVHELAELYKQPWVKHWYCSVCKIGQEKGYRFEQMDAAVALIQFLHGYEKLPELKKILMEILKDGIIDEREMKIFYEVCEELSDFRQSIYALEMQKEHCANSAHRKNIV